MREVVHIRRYRVVGPYRLWVQFTDDQDFFERVFIEMGVPTWPNGYDIDAINARMTLEAVGELIAEPAAA